jgi:hypothetical protein
MPQSYFIQDASAVCNNSPTMLVFTAQQGAIFEGERQIWHVNQGLKFHKAVSRYA